MAVRGRESSGRPRWAVGAVGLAVLGCAALLPWVYVTIIEVDAGWGDAIWRYSPWTAYAWAATAAGAVAAGTALLTALRYRSTGGRRLLRASALFLLAEVIAASAWVGLAFAAVS